MDHNHLIQMYQVVLNSWAFCASKLLKTLSPKSHQQPIEFKAYPHEVSLCAVALIKLYLDKTAALRRDVNSIFFISYAPPHKPVSSKTLASWVSDVLQKAGIQKAGIHSLRSASTSDVYSGGLSLTEIAKAAGWTNVRTFGKCYNKSVIENNFGSFLLTNSLWLYPYFRYCMLRIGTCMIYIVLYIYQFGLWNLIWILISGTGTEKQRNHSKN